MLLRTFANRGIANALAVRSWGALRLHRGEATSVPATIEEQRKMIELELREDLPKPYDGPERDLVNFPRLPRAEFAGKVRMGFLPNEWFEFFYKKTGVTGPYLFGTGFITFMLSKEFYVIEEEFSTGATIFLMIYFAVKKFGPSVKEFSNQQVADEIAASNKNKDANMKGLVDAIDLAKKDVWQVEGQKMLMQAKKDNVQVQLEAEYRSRMMQAYEAVKRRLDYHLDFHNTKRKLQQKHMVDWIADSVVKSITPQQEKEALQKCIDDLKLLSAKV